MSKVNSVDSAISKGNLTVESCAQVTGLTRLECIARMKELQAEGRGTFVVGRHGHVSRFVPKEVQARVQLQAVKHMSAAPIMPRAQAQAPKPGQPVKRKSGEQLLDKNLLAALLQEAAKQLVG